MPKARRTENGKACRTSAGKAQDKSVCCNSPPTPPPDPPLGCPCPIPEGWSGWDVCPYCWLVRIADLVADGQFHCYVPDCTPIRPGEDNRVSVRITGAFSGDICICALFGNAERVTFPDFDGWIFWAGSLLGASAPFSGTYKLDNGDEISFPAGMVVRIAAGTNLTTGEPALRLLIAVEGVAEGGYAYDSGNLSFSGSAPFQDWKLPVTQSTANTGGNGAVSGGTAILIPCDLCVDPTPQCCIADGQTAKLWWSFRNWTPPGFNAAFCANVPGSGSADLTWDGERGVFVANTTWGRIEVIDPTVGPELSYRVSFIDADENTWYWDLKGNCCYASLQRYIKDHPGFFVSMPCGTFHETDDIFLDVKRVKCRDDEGNCVDPPVNGIACATGKCAA